MPRNVDRVSLFTVLCLVATPAFCEAQDRNDTTAAKAAQANPAAKFRMRDEFDGKLALE